MHARVHACVAWPTDRQTHTILMHACVHASCKRTYTQELLELYDKIGHTKKMGITYSANSITNVSAGLQAEREGVCEGWRMCQVCCMAAACCVAHGAWRMAAACTTHVRCMHALLSDACCVFNIYIAGKWHGDAEQHIPMHMSVHMSVHMADKRHGDAEQPRRRALHPHAHRSDQEKGRADRHRLRAAERRTCGADVRELRDEGRPQGRA